MATEQVAPTETSEGAEQAAEVVEQSTGLAEGAEQPAEVAEQPTELAEGAEQAVEDAEHKDDQAAVEASETPPSEESEVEEPKAE